MNIDFSIFANLKFLFIIRKYKEVNELHSGIFPNETFFSSSLIATGGDSRSP